MCSPVISIRKITLYILALLSVVVAQGQYNIIKDKDLTRPEINRSSLQPAGIAALSARMNNGSNDIQWTSVHEQDTRKYIVEYSKDGINFQSAGEVTANNGMVYTVRHSTLDITPTLYRLKIEDFEGRYSFSRFVLLEGVTVSPVKVYPTIIETNAVTARAFFPVERVVVFNGSGQQVYAQDIGGRRESINIPLPSLAKGMYWIVFYGKDWKTTEKIIVS